MIKSLSYGYPLRYFDRGYLKKIEYKNKKLSLLKFLKLFLKFHNPCGYMLELKSIECDAYENYANVKEYCELIKDNNITCRELQKNVSKY
jgi:hypothetical protein